MNNNFNVKAHNYQDKAHIQKQIADDLLALLPTNKLLPLDLGMGPGINLKALTTRSKLVIGADISGNMVKEALNRHIHRTLALVIDAHYLAQTLQTPNILPHEFFTTYQSLGGFDMIFSSMALEWCNIECVFNELKKVSSKDCFYALTIPIWGTLTELKNIFKETKMLDSTLNFISKDLLVATLTNCGFSNTVIWVKTYQEHFTNAHDYLLSIRAIGANHKAQTYLTKSKYLSLMHNLNNILASQNYLTHTYQIAFIVSKRPE